MASSSASVPPHPAPSSVPTEAPAGPPQFLRRLLEPRYLGPIIGAVAVIVGLLVIHALHGRIHPDQLRSAIAATSPTAAALALGFTMVSFMALAGYDMLAVHRVVPQKVSMRLAALAGVIAYGFSNALGFNVFIGGPLRWRIYQSAGVDAADVGRIVSLSVMTAWGGMLALMGAALLLAPGGLPALQKIGPLVDRGLGALIVIGVVVLLIWLARGVRQLSFWGWRLPLPTGRQALAQIAIGAVDYGAASAALYVLLPADVAPPFAALVLLVIIAAVASIISHAPGGLGVFDATILIGLGAGTRVDVIAALIVFRLIYYVVPLVAAALALLAFETWRVRQRVPLVADRALEMTRHLVPPIAAVLALGGGLVLLFSGSTPAITARLDWLHDFLPLPFAEASHLLASLVGLLLIVVARGLYRRLRMARQMAVALLLAGALFALTRGADWEEASLLLIGAAVLAIYGRAFYRGGGWRAFRLTPRWMGLLLIAVGVMALVGFIAYRHVDYRSDLWWRFAWHDDAARFLRTLLVVGIVAAALIVDALINRPLRAAVPAADAVPPVVRQLLQTSHHAESCVALLGDKSFMLAPEEDAFLMYAVSGRSWITMGDPVGTSQAARDLIWRFADAADRAGARAIFYAVQPAYLPWYLDMNLALLKIGEVARVDLTTFALAGPARAGLRQAHNRAAREGLEFSVIPAAEVAPILPQLRVISDAWMQLKHGREKGFSIGRFDDAYLQEFDCAVLRKDGAIVAFANLWRSGDHNELSIDLMRYQPGISKIMMEALFVDLLLYGKEQGYQWFSLGAAPLSGLSDHPMASTWERIGTFIYKNGDEFYNFSGLRAFKDKFDPVWTPQYLACRGGLALAPALTNVTVLIAGGAMGVFKR